jgi:uncharacterized CHY-type Zn-finger protein
MQSIALKRARKYVGVEQVAQIQLRFISKTLIESDYLSCYFYHNELQSIAKTFWNHAVIRNKKIACRRNA